MSIATTVVPVVLEPVAQQFAEAAANPPYLFDLGPVEGRKTVDDVQSGEIEKPGVNIEDTTIALPRVDDCLVPGSRTVEGRQP